MKKVLFGLFVMAIATGAANAVTPVAGPQLGAMCDLISQLQGVFGILRTLAFIGAGFILANIAWDFIKGGDGKSSVTETLKAKGIPMIVGFALLFSIGMVLQFLGPIVNCPEIGTGW